MKKRSLKKTVSLLLALVLAVTLIVPSLAAGKSNQNPVLVVTGFSEYPLVNTATGEAAFPPSTDAIVNTVTGVLPSLMTLLGSGKTQADYDAFCDAALPVVNALFEPIACNPDGSVKHTEVGLAYQYPESAAEYGKNSEAYAQAFDKALLRSVANTVGADKTYVYGLDWRLSASRDRIHRFCPLRPCLQHCAGVPCQTPVHRLRNFCRILRRIRDIGKQDRPLCALPSRRDCRQSVQTAH